MFPTPICPITLFGILCGLSGRGYEKQMIEKCMNKTLAFEKHIDWLDTSYVNMQNKYHSGVYT